MELVVIYPLHKLLLRILIILSHHYSVGRGLQNYTYITEAEERPSQSSLHLYSSYFSYKSNELPQYVLSHAHPYTACLSLLLDYVRLEWGRDAQRGLSDR